MYTIHPSYDICFCEEEMRCICYKANDLDEAKRVVIELEKTYPDLQKDFWQITEVKDYVFPPPPLSDRLYTYSMILNSIHSAWGNSDSLMLIKEFKKLFKSELEQ